MSGVLSQIAEIDALIRLRDKTRAKREARRALRHLKDARVRCLASAFPQQRELVESTALRLVNHSGRRAGKTDAWALKLYLSGTAPGAENGISPFITSSLARSERLIGSALRKFNQDLKLGITRIEREGDIYYRLPNGHRIWVAGVKDSAEVDKFRGGKYHAAVIDECQGLTKFLKSLVMESIEPALMDYNGWLGLSGTPNVQPVGDWHELCTSGAFKQYHWDCRVNPYIVNAEQYIQDLLKRYNWTELTPRFVREYLGLWCVDKESICYPFNRDINWVPSLPEGEWQFAIGIDFGINDPCAWVVVAFQYGSPKIYVIHTEVEAQMSPGAAALKTIELKKRFKADLCVVDRGGIGSAFVKEWIDKYNLPAIAAKKVDAAGQIAMMAGELASGSIVVVGDQPQPIIDEWAVLPWNDEMTGHHDRYEDHRSDACRYIVRYLSGETPEEEQAPEPKREPTERELIIAERARIARWQGRR